MADTQSDIGRINLKAIGSIDGVVHDRVDGQGESFQTVKTRLTDGRIVSAVRRDNGEVQLWFFAENGELQSALQIEQNRLLRDSNIIFSDGRAESADGNFQKVFRNREFENTARGLVDSIFETGNVNQAAEGFGFILDTASRLEVKPRKANYTQITNSSTVIANGIDVSVLMEGNDASIFLRDSNGRNIGEIHAFSKLGDEGTIALVRADGTKVHDFKSMLDEKTLEEVKKVFSDGRVTNEEATTLAQFAQNVLRDSERQR